MSARARQRAVVSGTEVTSRGHGTSDSRGRDPAQLCLRYAARRESGGQGQMRQGPMWRAQVCGRNRTCGSRLIVVLVAGSMALAAVLGAGGANATAAGASPKGSGRVTCRNVTPATPPDGPTETATVVQEAGPDQPRVALVRYPRPDRPPGSSNPWSQWGQALVLRDGRVLSAMGDHQGRDGNSYLFVYDPNAGQLTRFTDVLSHVDHQ